MNQLKFGRVTLVTKEINVEPFPKTSHMDIISSDYPRRPIIDGK